LSVPPNDRVLIDYRTADDAGVYRLDDGRALVQTVDFFTPIVDDPFVYGQIAAANAMSDVYAMGGRPLTALAIAGFPKDLGRSTITAIFSGGVDMLAQAGVALLGGHTVQDQEIKFGYAITGELDPSRLWTNAGARAGDLLFLTKPLGTGVIATALKAGRSSEAVVDRAVVSMLTLNRAASEALLSLPASAVHACTDVTGFGLIGHGCEMAVASQVTLEIRVGSVPIFDGVLDLVADNIPGGAKTNAQHFGREVGVAPSVDLDVLKLLHDPQTSGGLLVAIDPGHESAVKSGMSARGVTAHLIGRVTEAARRRIELTA
jgi:selenide,water dikinase